MSKTPEKRQLQRMRDGLRKISCMGAADDEDESNGANIPSMPFDGHEHAEGQGHYQHQHQQHDEPVEAPAPTPTPAVYIDLTAEQLQRTADPQLGSPLFGALPAEIRRMVYQELWRAFLGPGLRMHVDRYPGARLHHTRCLADPDDAGPAPEPDLLNLAMEPGILQDWALRQRFGRHLRCNEERQRWLKGGGPGDVRGARDGDGGVAPFSADALSLFLTSKRIYSESVESLFQSATLVFTSSEAAHYFLGCLRPSHMHAIRSLDLSFTNHLDRLFLTPLQPPAAAAADGPPVGSAMWDFFTSCFETSLRDLRHLRVSFGPRHGSVKYFDLFDEWEARGEARVEMLADGTRCVSICRRDGQEEADDD